MSQASETSKSPWKVLLGSMGILIFFGFVVLILTGYVGHESPEEKYAKGDFSEEVTNARWENLQEVQEAQAELVDQEKLDKAIQALAGNAPKGAPTSIVVPGSPTFLKQSAAPAAEPEKAETPAAEEGAAPAPEKPAATPAPAPEAPAEKPAAPAPAPEKPAAPAPAPEKPAAPAPAPENP